MTYTMRCMGARRDQSSANGIKGGSGDGHITRVTSKVQGKAGDTCEGSVERARGCMGVHDNLS